MIVECSLYQQTSDMAVTACQWLITKQHILQKIKFYIVVLSFTFWLERTLWKRPNWRKIFRHLKCLNPKLICLKLIRVKMTIKSCYKTFYSVYSTKLERHWQPELLCLTLSVKAGANFKWSNILYPSVHEGTPTNIRRGWKHSIFITKQW